MLEGKLGALSVKVDGINSTKWGSQFPDMVYVKKKQTSFDKTAAWPYIRDNFLDIIDNSGKLRITCGEHVLLRP